MLKSTSSNADFLLPRPHPTLSPRHFILIHPEAARELTTKPRGRAFRRQFLPILRKRFELEILHFSGPIRGS